METHNFALYLSFIILIGLVVGYVVGADRRHRVNENTKASASLGCAFIIAGIVWQLMLYTGVGGNLTNVTYKTFMVPFVIGAVLTLPSAFSKISSWWKNDHKV